VSFVVGHSGRVAGLGSASFACKVHSERIAWCQDEVVSRVWLKIL
jgi:hypothetical protein